MMKKVILLMVLFCNIIIANAQSNDTVIYIANQPGIDTYGVVSICPNQYNQVVVNGLDGCSNHIWEFCDGYTQNDHITFNATPGGLCDITYWGCDGFAWSFSLAFPNQYLHLPTPSTQIVWKHQGSPLLLQAVGNDSINEYGYRYLWFTGETGPIIEITEPGTYSCEISDVVPCASVTRTFIVKDNVEVYRATVDLETKLNKVTWQVTPEQAEYISEVRVERDGMGVGSAPYEQGYFMDNIGSENAARNYRLTGITTDGTDCPIPSYQKGTLHVDYSPNASNPNKLNMAWTPPFIEEGASIAVTYFQICKYDPATGEVTVVDQIGANNTIGSYDVDLFDEGYAVVAAMFNEGKEYEELAFSNLTDFLVGIEENEGPSTPSTGSGTLTVYPNPAKDCFTVEGWGMMHLTNVLGQEIMAKEIDGKEIIALPQGLYFVKLNGATRKIVVE